MLSSVQQPSFDSTMCSVWMILFILEIIGLKGSQADSNNHLEIGKKLLAQGQLQDALVHIHTAIESDPKNYLAYFTRATIYLGLGKAKAATSDLSEVLKLKPDFVAARLQRGSTALKQGNLDEAHIDLESVLKSQPNNAEALRLYGLIESIKTNIGMATDLLKQSSYEHAIHYLNDVIEFCPWNPIVREMRADCYIQLGDYRQAIADLKPVTRLTSDNTQGYFKISNLFYQLGEVDDSLAEVRECLKLDPDHKDCYPFYKNLKKTSKVMSNMKEYSQAENFNECVKSAEKLLKLEPNIPMVKFQAYDKLCYCHLKAGQASESVSACTEAITLLEEPRLYCDRAEAHLANDMFDEAVSDYQKALNMDENFGRAKEGMQRAQKLLKQSKKRDYYKILGVKRTAQKQEITKAYRKMAQKWHPDNYSGDEKKAAEKKFIDIAAAKEVLTDPEKREKYDNGEDPLDPESQQGQGFNPFQHFQQFHQGGPFQFKFHFN